MLQTATSNQVKEIITVKIEPKTIVCCYYRPHAYLKNLKQLRDILEAINNKFPGQTFILVGDFNLPGIEWTLKQIMNYCQHKQLHRQFLDILNNFMLDQLVTGPTHVLGNTLDIICTNSPGQFTNINVVQPGLSDHYIVSATLKTSLPQPEKACRLSGAIKQRTRKVFKSICKNSMRL